MVKILMPNVDIPIGLNLGAVGVTDESVKNADEVSGVTVVIGGDKDVEVCKAIDQIPEIKKLITQVHGAVSIESITVRWQPIAAKAQIAFLLTKTGSATTKSTYMQKPNAGGAVATSYNCGEWRTFKLVIPDGLAKQLSPVSGVYPGMEMFLYATGEAVWAVDFEIMCHGRRFIYGEGF